MLCFGVDSGTKKIDFGGDGLGNVNWTRASGWCALQGRQLMIGDFNGDNRDDLLCNDVATGQIWIDFADGTGKFFGSDYTRSGPWCTSSNGRIFVGDVNAGV